MIRRPPGSTLTVTLFPDTALFRAEQVVPVPFGGQVCDVAVPVEQVEGRIVVAEQIIPDDIIPDQVAPAQRVEGRGHVAAVEIALGRKLRSEEHTSDLQSRMRITYAVFCLTKNTNNRDLYFDVK